MIKIFLLPGDAMKYGSFGNVNSCEIFQAQICSHSTSFKTKCRRDFCAKIDGIHERGNCKDTERKQLFLFSASAKQLPKPLSVRLRFPGGKGSVLYHQRNWKSRIFKIRQVSNNFNNLHRPYII